MDQGLRVVFGRFDMRKMGEVQKAKKDFLARCLSVSPMAEGALHLGTVIPTIMARR